MKRRGFLTTTGSVVAYSSLASPALAKRKRNDVDFEALIEDIFADLPKDPAALRDELVFLANTIVNNSQRINWALINDALSSVGDAKTLVRRTQFAIQILQNQDVANYLDEAWVAAAKSHLKIVTRFLPLVASFNNLYISAAGLDTAAEKAATLSNIAEETYENFSYSIATFALEVGLWWFGAPYRMAWRGTRFVSNRTLLRGVNYLDNRLIAFLMSEIHWKIREKIYAEISADDLDSTTTQITYLVDQFDELRSFATTESVRTDSGSYLDEVDLDVDASELRQYDFIGNSDDSSGSGILSGGIDIPWF